MAFSFPQPTPIFPLLPGLTYSVHKRPTWASLQFMAVSGRRVTSPQQAFPLWEFELMFEFLRDQTQNIDPYTQYAGQHEFTQLSELFNACAGMAGQFYFTDPDDNSRMGQALGTGDGTTTIFTANRDWGYGTLVVPEPVGGINQLLNVYANGIALASNLYSFAGNQITFLTAPTVGTLLTMDLTFYYLCQFLEDQHDYEEFMKNLWTLKSCKIRSVKL